MSTNQSTATIRVNPSFMFAAAFTYKARSLECLGHLYLYTIVYLKSGINIQMCIKTGVKRRVAMPVWPADLPTPIFKSTLITGIKSTLRGDMDSGPAKQRPQFTKTPRLVSLSYLLFLAYRQGANFYG
jgi:hypothetical protein